MELLGTESTAEGRKCRHRRTWVVSFIDIAPGTDTTSYVKYRQCRRCGAYLERVN
ncbi:MAG: hypothetical protein ACR2PK_19225 [Acidimicrobiales bacterium]